MFHEAGKSRPGESPATNIETQPSRAIRARAAYSSLPKGRQIGVAALLIVVAPLAFPAWGIEWLIRRWRPGFEFRAFNSTPYFLAVTLIATTIVVAVPIMAAQISALYLLTLMELISLSVCAAIAIISPGSLQRLNIAVARRNYKPRTITASRSTVYEAVASANYAILYFGTLSYALWRADRSYFGGVSKNSPPIYNFWEFIQNSFLTITNAGATLEARRFLSQVIGDFERMVGIFLFVFLLSVLASSWAERALKGASADVSPDSTTKDRAEPG